MRAPLLLVHPSLTFAACLIAAPLGAQIRMPKPHLPNPLNRAATSARPGPTYDDRVLEITEARAAGLLKGLKAEQDARPALAAAYKRNADARAAAAVASRSPEEQTQECIANTPEYRAMTSDTASAAMTALATRVQALQARGDYATISKISDSVSRAAARRDSSFTAARQRCAAAAGQAATVAPPPVEPRIPLADSLHIIGAGAAGVTPDQYSILRERVQAYLASNESDLRSSMYVYSGDEMTVLRNRRAQFTPYATVLSEQ